MWSSANSGLSLHDFLASGRAAVSSQLHITCLYGCIGLCEDPMEFLCPNYTEANQIHDADIIKGIIAWESLGSILMTNATLGELSSPQPAAR